MSQIVVSMRASLLRLLTVPALLLSGASAFAATYYVGPMGAGQTCSRDVPCSLSDGALKAMAGDTVILLDGTYHEPLNPENSGTPDAWITFKADECALPIIEGPGEAILMLDPAPSGVFSNTASYLRFIGIASRHWDSGFTNGWTGKDTTNSNGHIEYINCIGDGNGRTGFAMYSAGAFTTRECISAHNGGNPTGSWSSGIQLYSVPASLGQTLIERNVSFENTDAEKKSDGSGFIVDESTIGAIFKNNLAFANGGSCMRMTRSESTKMYNFTCYHNGMNPEATGPTNPGEVYFNDDRSRTDVLFTNAIAAAAGTPQDITVYRNPPSMGISAANLTIDSGPTPFFTDPDGVNPDFRPPAQAAAQVENLGDSNGAPEVDIGFDPKCIIKRNPEVPFQGSWWIHSIDYDYIRSIGGIAKCFHPKARTGGVDLGAYEMSGPPHTFSTPGSCVPTPDPSPTTPDPVGSSTAPAPSTPEPVTSASASVGPSEPAPSATDVAPEPTSGPAVPSAVASTTGAPGVMPTLSAPTAAPTTGAPTTGTPTTGSPTATTPTSAPTTVATSPGPAAPSSAPIAPGETPEQGNGCACGVVGQTAHMNPLGLASIALLGAALRLRSRRRN
jgi:hypothetical protein